MSDRDKIQLASIADSIRKIQNYSAGFPGADEFYADTQAFDASMMNFVIIGEMVARLSESFMREHGQVDWARIKGFRNLVAHNYFGIDAEEVWQIIKNKLPQLKAQIEAIPTATND
ncbi:MAG: DUF86 domain-containing protein [Spirochaetes bacterium]|nr:MAG: DUF86 domain-containing protein [Spirochaetota bacterium]